MSLQTGDKLDIDEAQTEFMMNWGKAIYNWSKHFAILFALVLSLGTLCVPKARAQASPSIVVVNFKTASTMPLNPGFNGFNSTLKNAVEYYDTNFQNVLTTLSPGWLRFPASFCVRPR